MRSLGEECGRGREEPEGRRSKPEGDLRWTIYELRAGGRVAEWGMRNGECGMGNAEWRDAVGGVSEDEGSMSSHLVRGSCLGSQLLFENGTALTLDVAPVLQFAKGVGG